ncbi:MAG: phosphate/phosphite/phosphonate ABC transporter substrate-binding protein [Pseudomonadota bacterium]
MGRNNPGRSRPVPAVLSRGFCRWAARAAMGLGMAAAFALAACSDDATPAPPPLKVVLIPADGGTESGTRADFQPIFDAISRESGLRFDLTVAQSYGAVVEALCSGNADIAFVGAVTFVQAEQRGCADFLAVAVKDGQSGYYAGLFTLADSPVHTIADLRGRRAAFGDVNSTSSFLVPVSMMLRAGINPARDLSRVAMMGSHANSMAALVAGQVDVAALSFESFDKAVANGAVRADQVRVLARSDAIPYPPIVVRRGVDEALKQRLRRAFDGVAMAPGVDPAMIRGYGGERVDSYRSDFDSKAYDRAIAATDIVTDPIRSEILAAAARR